MNGQTAQNRHFTLNNNKTGIVAIMAANSLSAAQKQAGQLVAARQKVIGQFIISESTIEEIMQVLCKGGNVPMLS